VWTLHRQHILLFSFTHSWYFDLADRTVIGIS